MVSVLFISIIRDGITYLGQYYEQLNSLNSKYKITLAITEGDSTDDTYTYLKQNISRSGDVKLFKFDHKGKKYGSVNNPDRWQRIAMTWNSMLNKLEFDYDYVIYMEADLIWDIGTIDKLIEGLQKGFGDAIAPMSMLGSIFYDTWGHRAFGENFGAIYPFHSQFTTYDRYMPLESAGSCIAMKPTVIRQCRLNPVDAMIGHDIKKFGYTFVLDKQARVLHP